MKRSITEEDVRNVLEGFVQAGLVRKISTTTTGDEQITRSPPPKSPLRGQAKRNTKRPPKLPSGGLAFLSARGQGPLLKTVAKEFCARFIAGGTVLYIGDSNDKLLYLDAEYLKRLGVEIPAPAKMPDLVVHDTKRNWLALIEVVTSAGPVDGKRRKELKDLFAGCSAGLVFVTAFSTREIMRSFLTQISWETEVWVAQDPEHLIHFNGERFLGPYPDVMPKAAIGQ
jgi:hypothetical protein